MIPMNESETMKMRAPRTGMNPRMTPEVCQRSKDVLRVAAIMMKYIVPARSMNGGTSGPEARRYLISMKTYTTPTTIQTPATAMGIIVNPNVTDCHRKLTVNRMWASRNMPIPGTRSTSIPTSPNVQNTRATVSKIVNRVGGRKSMTNIAALSVGIILIRVVGDASFFSPAEAALSCKYIETMATIQKTAL